MVTSSELGETTGWFVTVGGARLRQRSWRRRGDVGGIVALLHGGAEHSGRYRHTAERFTAAGFGVDAFDQRSHGESDRVRGVGLQVDRFDDLLDDTEAWLASRREAAGRVPLFVVAHSMGALISIALATQRRLRVDGLVSCGAALTVIAPKAFARAAERAAAEPDAIVHRIPRGGSEDSTRDPAMIAVAAADPVHADIEGIPARFLSEVARTTARVVQELHCVDVPLLALHGTADKMADPQRSVELVQRATSQDKTLHLVDGGWHALLRDVDRARTEDVILRWMEERLPEQPATAS